MRRVSRKSFQNIKIMKYTQAPSGRILKNKYIVYDADTMKPISGMSGQSLYTAKNIKSRVLQGQRQVNIINYYVESPNKTKIATGFFVLPNRESKFQKDFKKKYPNTTLFQEKSDILTRYPSNYKIKFRKGVTYL